jgi:hypothetical protein
LNYPKITKGLGKLTPELFKRIIAMLKAYESGSIVASEGTASSQPSTTMPLTAGGGLNRPYFLAKITASSALATNRYYYTWTEVVLDDSDAFDVRDNSRTGTAALNLCEMSNTADTVGAGIDVGSATYPSGFSMMPIGKAGDDTLIDVLVVMYGVRDDTGALRAVFSLANAHDGVCS